jgi:DNA-binding transcriptional ArsR family regulator
MRLARADPLLTRIRAEIDSRMRELEPRLDEYEELQSVLEVLERDRPAPASRASSAAVRVRLSTPARSTPPRPIRTPSRAARPRGPARGRRKVSIDAAGRAILAALEHGSHTVAELVVVTAVRAPAIRHSLRRLRARGAIVKTSRDGRTAYALAEPTA